MLEFLKEWGGNYLQLSESDGVITNLVGTNPKSYHPKLYRASYEFAREFQENELAVGGERFSRSEFTAYRMAFFAAVACNAEDYSSCQKYVDAIGRLRRTCRHEIRQSVGYGIEGILMELPVTDSNPTGKIKPISSSADVSRITPRYADQSPSARHQIGSSQNLESWAIAIAENELAAMRIDEVTWRQALASANGNKVDGRRIYVALRASRLQTQQGNASEEAVVEPKNCNPITSTSGLNSFPFNKVASLVSSLLEFYLLESGVKIFDSRPICLNKDYSVRLGQVGQQREGDVVAVISLNTVHEFFSMKEFFEDDDCMEIFRLSATNSTDQGIENPLLHQVACAVAKEFEHQLK